VWSIATATHALAQLEGGLKIKDTQGRTFTRHTTESTLTVTSSWTDPAAARAKSKYAYNSDGKLETYTKPRQTNKIRL